MEASSDRGMNLRLAVYPCLPFINMYNCLPPYLMRVFLRLQNGRFFFPKSVKKSVKRGVRVLRARSARACEAREKNRLSVLHTMSSFWPGGLKMSSSCQKNCSQLHPLCEFDTLGDWFRGRIARVIVCTWLRILTLYPVNSKANFSVVSVWNILNIVKCRLHSVKWVEVAVRHSPVSLSVFSLVPDLLFDCSRLLEYAKIRTFLQSSSSCILITVFLHTNEGLHAYQWGSSCILITVFLHTNEGLPAY